MLRKSFVIALLSLLAIAFLASQVFAEKTAQNFFQKQAKRLKSVSYNLSGAEQPIENYVPSNGGQSLGADFYISNSPGLVVGETRYDLQSNTRNNRQVDWRGTYSLHFVWMKQIDDTVPGGDRGTGYEMWDTDLGSFVFSGPGGGCDIHPRLGSGNNYSGYVGMDVDTEGKVVIGNHHDNGAGYASTVWYDFTPGACFFSPYTRRVPDTTQQYGIPGGATGEFEMIWPSMDYQVYNGDTVTHVFSMQFESEIDASFVHYFRRVGSDTLGVWDYPPVLVDTIPTISQTVTAARTSGKVALVWHAPPGSTPGASESLARDVLDDGLGSSQRMNDIYYMTSTDMGANWSSKINATAYDSSQGGWLGHGDMSCLITSDDNLHFIWPAREIIATQNTDAGVGLGEYANFYGARLLHWSEDNPSLRPVADANWEITDEMNERYCTGGAWNEMSIVKPMLSECDGKLYSFFVQFHDVNNGIWDDCAACSFPENGDACGWSGTANGELYVSVSDNDGFNWDVPRNLTNTRANGTGCYADESEGLPVCESDHYPATSRYGMYVDPGDDPDFFDAITVDPSSGYTGAHFIDVQYVNDKFPGSVMQDDGIWTYNPVKWFRVPCVEPIPNPVLVYQPQSFNQPLWTKPGVTLDTTFYLENIGNAPLTVASVIPVGLSHTNCLAVSDNGPITISHTTGIPVPITLSINANPPISPSPAIMNGYIEISSDALGGSVDSVTVSVIIADTVQEPEYSEVRTDCLRLAIGNNGNAGNSGTGDFNLDFFVDCDTLGNTSGDNDNASVYLYDASPFVLLVDGVDTIMYHYMFGNGWLDDDGWRPQEGVVSDSTSFADYRYGYSGKVVSADSSIGLSVEYFAPTDGDSCNFIVMKQKFWNEDGNAKTGLYFGDAMDWDIPSDSGSANGSDYDAARQAVWCYGAEYSADTLDDGSASNNDCILADQRYGGYAYYSGFKLPYQNATNDSVPFVNAQLGWTENNADWVYPTGDLVAGEILQKIDALGGGYETWEATGDFTNPDSMFTDLHMISVFRSWDLGANDTLVFVKVIASEYDGGESGLLASIDEAKAWIAGRPDLFHPPEISGTCCVTPGDANHNGAVNILDITYLIAYLYSGGPPPPCMYEGDANGNCAINILDITYLIGYLYGGGPGPVCAASCPGW